MYTVIKVDYLQGLNQEQKRAVLTEAPHVRIIAGAGSGKTRVLTTRIVHLIADRGYYPAKLCAITFTNKAANEMRERLEMMLPETRFVHVSTIHSLCVRILREEYEAIGLVRSFTILDAADQQAVLREAYKEYGYDRKTLSYFDVLNAISNYKIAGVSVSAAESLIHNEYDQKRVKVYKYYVARLKQLQALDFDDLLLETRNLFHNQAAIRSKWQHRFRVVFVDEFQDVDAIQYDIVQALVGDENELYVVGDPDQTIYSWRGANVNFIVDFEKRYPDSETIILNQNYRSTQAILNSANALIENNKNRPPKELFANKESAEKVHYNSLDDSDSEAYFIARTIEKLKEAGSPYLDTAVLYRSNYLSRALEKALIAYRIPYVIYGGLRFYDHAEVKDMLSYLRMITHGDDLALRRSIQNPRRGIGDKTLDTYSAKAQERDVSMYELMLEETLNHLASPKVAKYVALIEDLKKYEREHDLESTVNYALDKSDLIQHFEKQQELERLENLKELVADVVSYQQSRDEPSLDEYVQMVSLYGDRNEVIEGDYVRLMTVHAAKGLEFANVILMGVSDTVFPNKNSIQEGPEGLQEERRLMYVAITRARERLILTNHTGFSFVTGMYSKPSRFIQEMATADFVYDHKPAGHGLKTAAQENLQTFENKALRSKKIKIKASDVVVHDEFGEGIVIRVEDDTVKVAFNFPYGTRIISRKYSGLKLKGELS